MQRIVIGRALLDAAPPPHQLAADGRAGARSHVRARGRSVVAGKAVRVASKTQPSLIKLPMRVLTPAQKDGR